MNEYQCYKAEKFVFLNALILRVRYSEIRIEKLFLCQIVHQSRKAMASYITSGQVGMTHRSAASGKKSGKIFPFGELLLRKKHE